MQDDVDAAAEPDPAALILAIAAQRDREAFVALFKFYAPRIKSMLIRMGAPAEVAEDVAQETLLAVWRKAVTYRPERAGASTWVYTIARNLRIDRLRREQRAEAICLYDALEPDGPVTPDDQVEAAQHESRVREAIETLPNEQIRVLQLSFFEGLAHGDIAERLGIPLGTVKSRLRLAMARLREHLGDLS